MKKIKAIHLSYFTADAHLMYMVQFKDLVDESRPIKTLLGTKYQDFLLKLGKEGEVFQIMKKSDLTDPLAEAARRVDRALIGMNTAVAAALHHPDHTVVVAAQSLHNRLKAFGNIARKNYEEESADVNMLLMELAGPEYAAKVTLVGLTTWVTELTAAEAAFEALYTQRRDEESQKPQETMLEARRDTDAAYRPIIEALNAHTVVDDVATEGLETLIEKLNTNIERYNNIYRPTKKDLSVSDHCVVVPIDTQTYTEKAVTPIPKVYYREEGKPTVELTFAKDFSVTYKNNVNVGMAECIIHGKGEYKGQVTVTFNIARV
jgi:hypothetical protein